MFYSLLTHKKYQIYVIYKNELLNEVIYNLCSSIFQLGFFLIWKIYNNTYKKTQKEYKTKYIWNKYLQTVLYYYTVYSMWTAPNSCYLHDFVDYDIVIQIFYFLFKKNHISFSKNLGPVS